MFNRNTKTTASCPGDRVQGGTRFALINKYIADESRLIFRLLILENVVPTTLGTSPSSSEVAKLLSISFARLSLTNYIAPHFDTPNFTSLSLTGFLRSLIHLN